MFNLVKLMQKSTKKQKTPPTTPLTGIIRDATLLKNGCVFGYVVKDFRGRFETGNWIRTSRVLKREKDFVHTMNSVYKIEGELVIENVTSPYNLI